jgi:hypothetical protein
MIQIEAKITENGNDGPSRELTQEEKELYPYYAGFDGTHYKYQSTKPEIPVIEFTPAPNWLGLEQDLRYSALFGKAFNLAKQSLSVNTGFNFVVSTLQNGVAGRASENALSFALANLGVDWTEEEKETFNNILETNNFLLRL